MRFIFVSEAEARDPADARNWVVSESGGQIIPDTDKPVTVTDSGYRVPVLTVAGKRM
jgi:hypothetical protein